MAKKPTKKSIAELKKDLEDMKGLGVDKKFIDKVELAISEQEKEEKENEKKRKEAEKKVAELTKQAKEEEKKKKEQKKKVADNVKKFTKDQKKKEEEDTKDLEEIDQEILDILGLDKFDLEMDPEEYRTLLLEKIQENKQKGQDISNAKLAQERKRVRGSDKKYTAQKKKTVKPSNFVGKDTTKKEEPQKIQTDKLLPSAGQTGGSIEGEDIDARIEEVKAEIEENTQEKLLPLSQSLDDIAKALEGILNTNQKKLEIEQQAARDAAKKEETAGFKKKEAELEEPDIDKKIEEGLEKKLNPTTSIFDMILNFFKNILLGGAITGLLSIFKNPAGFLTGLTNFLNDFINFANGIIQQVSQFIFAPFNAVITSINSALNEIEYALAQIAKVVPGVPTPKFPNIPPLALPPLPTIPPNALANLLNVQQQAGGGEVMPDGMSFLEGGAIDNLSGMKIKGMGKDTQLIAAQPGEVMMSKKAVDMFGADTLLGMNAAAGGTNKPKYGKVPGFQEGGMIDIRRATSRDVGSPTMGTASKGVLIVPGHYGYGGGTPGNTSGLSRQAGMASGWDEYLANVMIGKEVVKQVKALNPAIPIRFYEKPGGFENSNRGLANAIAHYKDLEAQGYEVIELHHDEPRGRGGLLGSYTNYSSLDKRLAELGGNFGFGYKGRFQTGYGMNKGGISMFEVAPLGGQYEQGLISGDKNATLAGAAPLVQAITEVYGGNRQSPTPEISQTTPQASVTRTKVDISVAPPQSQNTGGATQVLPVPQSTGQLNSAASAAQGRIPNFGAEDGGNFDLIVVKSIYNIVG
jgi:hypothetical protein